MVEQRFCKAKVVGSTPTTGSISMKIVQIGCNNCDDHVFELVSKNADSIETLIVVDPLAKCVEVAKQKYAFLAERLIVVQCAISPTNGVAPFYCPVDDDMSVVASLSKDHIYAHHHSGFTPRGPINEAWVPCLTINSFLESFVSLQTGFHLYIDTEGHDVDILLGLDLSRFRVSKIQWESIHSDGPFRVGPKAQALLQQLHRHGYVFDLCDTMNVVATLP